MTDTTPPKKPKKKATKKKKAAKQQIIEPSKMGAPIKYDPKYCEMIINFFAQPLTRDQKITKMIVDQDVEDEDGKVTSGGRRMVVSHETRANDLPTLVSFAQAIGVNYSTLWNWTKEYPDFLEAYEHSKQLQQNFLVQNGLHKRYNAGLVTLILMNNHGFVKNPEPPPNEDEIVRSITRQVVDANFNEEDD